MLAKQLTKQPKTKILAATDVVLSYMYQPNKVLTLKIRLPKDVGSFPPEPGHQHIPASRVLGHPLFAHVLDTLRVGCMIEDVLKHCISCEFAKFWEKVDLQHHTNIIPSLHHLLHFPRKRSWASERSSMDVSTTPRQLEPLCGTHLPWTKPWVKLMSWREGRAARAQYQL
eukprot:4082941-Amphidinium_carterae.1